jgi:hypothetical protein
VRKRVRILPPQSLRVLRGDLKVNLVLDESTIYGSGSSVTLTADR